MKILIKKKKKKKKKKLTLFKNLLYIYIHILFDVKLYNLF